MPTDNFNRTSLGANWTVVTGAFAIYNSDDVHSNQISSETGAAYTGATFNADQYAQIVIANFDAPGTFPNDPYIGIAVRCSNSAATYYGFYVGRAYSSYYILRMLNGTSTELVSGNRTFVVGDTIRLEVEGTTLRAFHNSTQIWSGTDNSISSGYAGIAGYSADIEVRGDDWEGNNLGGTPTLELEGYRWRNDDGSESAATWKAAQDTAITQAAGSGRLRLLVNATGDPASLTFKLQYRIDGSSWQDAPVET